MTRKPTGTPKRPPARPIRKLVPAGDMAHVPPGSAAGERLRNVCRSLVGTTEDIKWVDNLVFSVGDKMYAIFDTDGSNSYSFKCDDVDFDRLTERDGIVPAPYCARFGWVKVTEPGSLGKPEAAALLRKAHAMVAASLSKKKQVALGLAREL